LQLTDLKRRPLSGLTLTQSSSHWNSAQLRWLITWLSPGGGEKMSKHAVAAGGVARCLEEIDVDGLLSWVVGLNPRSGLRKLRQ
jgi:hypothetical protein